MKRTLFLFLLILIIITLNTKISFALIRINEIMYDPQGGDNNTEYVELYSDEPVNLSKYLIGDLSGNDSLKLIKSDYENNFILIVEDGFNQSNLTCSIYSAGKSIGNALGNNGDTILLFNKNKELMDEISYAHNYANGNGKALSLVNGFWAEQDPTPCYSNLLNDSHVNKNNEDNILNAIKNDSTINISVSIKIGDTKNIMADEKQDAITSSVVFESESQKAKNLLPYGIIAILLIIAIVLIIRR